MLVLSYVGIKQTKTLLMRLLAFLTLPSNIAHLPGKGRQGLFLGFLLLTLKQQKVVGVSHRPSTRAKVLLNSLRG